MLEEAQALQREADAQIKENSPISLTEGEPLKGWHNGTLYCYGGCGTRYRDFQRDVHLPTALWNRIAVGAPFDETQENIDREGRGGVLCPSCIVTRLSALPDCTVIVMDIEQWNAASDPPRAATRDGQKIQRNDSPESRAFWDSLEREVGIDGQGGIHAEAYPWNLPDAMNEDRWRDAAHILIWKVDSLYKELKAHASLVQEMETYLQHKTECETHLCVNCGFKAWMHNYAEDYDGVTCIHENGSFTAKSNCTCGLFALLRRSAAPGMETKS